jgi:hypothetical protein
MGVRWFFCCVSLPGTALPARWFVSLTMTWIFAGFCRIARRYASLRTTTKSHVMLTGGSISPYSSVIANRLALHRKATKSHVMLTGGSISPYSSVIANRLALHRKTTKSHVMLTGGGISLYGIVLRGFTTFHCRA